MEYAKNWDRTKSKVYRGTRKCCSCFIRNAKYVHHLKYTRSPLRRILGLFLGHNVRRSNVGFEIPGWDVVPVCEQCHEQGYGSSTNPKSVHFTGHPNPKWLKIYSKDILVVLNRNSDWMMFRLRVSWILLTNKWLCLAIAGFLTAFTITGLMKLF